MLTTCFGTAAEAVGLEDGVAVACQAGRSQHQNRDEAWKMLRARLYEAELQKHANGASRIVRVEILTASCKNVWWIGDS